MSERTSRTDWERLERASRIADREDFERTTPGQRIEQQLIISREMTKLAADAERRR